MKKRHTMTVKGYVARDENGLLFFYPRAKPKRDYGIWVGAEFRNCFYSCPDEPSVDITWEDEPREAIMTMHVDVESK